MKKAFALGMLVLFASACGSAASPATATAPTRAATPNALSAATGTPQHSMSPAEMAAMAPSTQPTASAPTAATAQPVRTAGGIATTAPAPTAIATTAPVQATPTTAPANAGPATTVNITLTDAAIRTSTATAPSGKVTFLITNGGAVEHEFVVLQTSLPQNAIPVDPTNAALVQEPGLLGKTASLAPKASTTLSLSLPAGTYVLICNELAHYMALGMHTAFSVR